MERCQLQELIDYVQDPWKLLSSDPPITSKYLHSHERTGRRVVLSKELLDDGKLTNVTIVTHDMIARFLDKVEEKSREAKRQGVSLMILIFCPGTESNAVFHLNHEDISAALTFNQLNGRLEPGCEVTLISTACYSGGWLVNRIPSIHNDLHPRLKSTTGAAAAAASAGYQSSSWTEPKSTRRAGGSIFTSAIIESMASLTTSLSGSVQGHAEISGDSSSQQGGQPDVSNSRQTATYNHYCQIVWDIAAKMENSLHKFQKFTFSARDETWGHPWTGSTSIPVTDLEARWKSLDVVPYSGNDSVHEPGSISGANRKGRFPEDKADRDAIFLLIEQLLLAHDVLHMIPLFRNCTCPGDWSVGHGQMVSGTLSDISMGKGGKEGKKEAFELIHFRWETAKFADHLVARFRLPVPSGEPCIFWHYQEWVHDLSTSRTKSYEFIWQCMVDREFSIKPYGIQGPPFRRFNYYICAAVTEANLSERETTQLLDEILAYKEFAIARLRSTLDSSLAALQAKNAWLREISRTPLEKDEERSEP